MDDLIIKRVQPGDELTPICDQTRPELWDKANAMTQYRLDALSSFLASPANWLVIAWSGDQISGMAVCYELLHPSGDEHALYVDEIDTRPDFLRRGVATELMRWVQHEAKTHGLAEVWLGTETDNVAANALYTSLKPDETDTVNLYTYHQ